MRFVNRQILGIILLSSGCKPIEITNVEIISCVHQIGENGKINFCSCPEVPDIDTKFKTKNTEKFEELLEKVKNDNRYKSDCHDFKILFYSANHALLEELRINTNDAGGDSVYVMSSDFNGYLCISKEEWNELITLTIQ